MKKRRGCQRGGWLSSAMGTAPWAAMRVLKEQQRDQNSQRRVNEEKEEVASEIP